MRILKIILFAVLFVACVFIATANMHEVRLAFPNVPVQGWPKFQDVYAPLFVVILATLLIGVLLAGLSTLLEQVRLRTVARRARKERDRAVAVRQAAERERDAALGERESLRAQIEAARGETEAARAELASVTADRDARHRELERQMTELENLRAELERLRAELEARTRAANPDQVGAQATSDVVEGEDTA